MGTVGVVTRWWPRGVAVAGILVAGALVLSACSDNHGSAAPGLISPADAATTSDSAAAATSSAAVTVPASTSPAATSGSDGSGAGSGTDATGAAEPSAPLSSALPTTSNAPSASSSSTPPPPPPAARVKSSPSLGTTDILPTDRVSISVTGGTIKSLTFTNPEGNKVKGALTADHKSWTLSEDLGYGRTYTVNGTAVNSVGQDDPDQGELHDGVHDRADHHHHHPR